ncbi:MAG: YceI family protein [Fibrobacteria bacterium]
MKAAMFAAMLSLAAARNSAAKTYEAIKGESTLTYRMAHPMHKFAGVSRDVKCLVELSPDTLSSVIQVSAAVSSFDSKNSSRDSHAMEAVQSRKFPRVEFASDSIKSSGEGYAVWGKLTFHGQVRPVTFQVTPKQLPGKIEIMGGFDVKLSDFGVERPRLMFVPVADKLGISFDLFAYP